MICTNVQCKTPDNELEFYSYISFTYNFLLNCSKNVYFQAKQLFSFEIFGSGFANTNLSGRVDIYNDFILNT